MKREDYDALVHVGRTHLIGKCDIVEPPSLHWVWMKNRSKKLHNEQIRREKR